MSLLLGPLDCRCPHSACVIWLVLFGSFRVDPTHFSLTCRSVVERAVVLAVDVEVDVNVDICSDNDALILTLTPSPGFV